MQSFPHEGLDLAFIDRPPAADAEPVLLDPRLRL